MKNVIFNQMSEISEKLVLEQLDDNFWSVHQLGNFPCRQLSLANDEEVISLSHAKFTYSQILCCVLES